jgi:type IV pilus assembly protein PilB
LAPIFDEKELENIKFYEWKGCEKCSNTWYKWRLGFHEVMIVEENLEPLILAEESAISIWNQAIKNWMITIIQDALIKALMWQTTIEEALQLI